MASGSAIKGSRVGSGPTREGVKGAAIARAHVRYWCANGHVSEPAFAAEGEIEVPEFWDCQNCGLPAGRDRNNPPSPPRNTPFKTHLDYVRERRSDKEGEELLADALAALRERRGEK